VGETYDIELCLDSLRRLEYTVSFIADALRGEYGKNTLTTLFWRPFQLMAPAEWLESLGASCMRKSAVLILAQCIGQACCGWKLFWIWRAVETRYFGSVGAGEQGERL
jgi:hypothetical protein